MFIYSKFVEMKKSLKVYSEVLLFEIVKLHWKNHLRLPEVIGSVVVDDRLKKSPSGAGVVVGQLPKVGARVHSDGELWGAVRNYVRCTK